METYEINTEFFKKCLRAVSRDEKRYNITGVYIHDKEGIRHYVGTNGHILVHCKAKTVDYDSYIAGDKKGNKFVIVENNMIA